MTKIKYFLFFISAIFFLSAPRLVSSANQVNIYFFWGEGCPHCAKEEELLDFYSHKYKDIKILDFEVYKNFNNGKILSAVASNLGVQVSGVPFTIIGDKHFSGFSEKITPSEIAQRIEFCQNNFCPDIVGKVIEGVVKNTENNLESKNKPIVNVQETANNQQNKFSLPILGEINATSFSLPLISIVMGVLDGFNPCAMWTLLFLISLLLGMQNKKRMWILGSAFIIASALVYFFFMAAWLNLIMFIGLVIWVRLLIGGIALFGGGYNLKDFFFNKNISCKVTNTQKRQKVFARLKQITQQNSFWLALLGIVLLAFAVNLVELICSAGLPAVFTQILALNNLPTWQYYLYISLYILFFMIDDLFVFFVAMITLQMTGITNKYTRYSKLIGGVLMLIIGLLLIFKPGWLMF